MRDSLFCYYHSRSTRPGPRRRASSDQSLELPPLEDPSAIYCALIEVSKALAESRISVKKAQTLIGSLRLAERVFNADAASAFSGGALFGTPAGGQTIAPELHICTDEDDCSRCEFAPTCTNPQRRNYP